MTVIRWDPFRDFVPVIQLTRQPVVLDAWVPQPPDSGAPFTTVPADAFTADLFDGRSNGGQWRREDPCKY